MTNYTHLFALVATVSGCISESVETAELEHGLSAYGWLNDLEVPDQTSRYQVGVASFNGRLHVLYKSVSTSLLAATSFDGSTWSSPTTSNLQADYGPALAVHDGRLVTVYNSSEQDRLLMATSSNGTTWSQPVQVGAPFTGGTPQYAPAIGSLNGKLYLAYCYRDSWGDKVRLDRLDATGWTNVKYVALTDSVCKSVALGRNVTSRYEIDGRLDFVFSIQTPTTWRIYDGRIEGNGTVFMGIQTPMSSKKPLAVATCSGITHLLHGGGGSTPEEIWWTYRGSNGSFVQDARVPSQASHGGAGLGCLNGRAIMVHNGGDDQLHWSEYVPD